MFNSKKDKEISRLQSQLQSYQRMYSKEFPNIVSNLYELSKSTSNEIKKLNIYIQEKINQFNSLDQKCFTCHSIVPVSSEHFDDIFADFQNLFYTKISDLYAHCYDMGISLNPEAEAISELSTLFAHLQFEYSTNISSLFLLMHNAIYEQSPHGLLHEKFFFDKDGNISKNKDSDVRYSELSQHEKAIVEIAYNTIRRKCEDFYHPDNHNRSAQKLMKIHNHYKYKDLFYRFMNVQDQPDFIPNSPYPNSKEFIEAIKTELKNNK